ncbi:MAG: GHKL domain-containing protein [Acidobacteria bacterium]|nr:GHKL domain-containing protein [Acidobacteriota bacterium]
MSEDGRTTPSERVPRKDLLVQLERARAESALAPILDAIGEMAAVLTEQRQVVFANKAMVNFAGSGSVEQLCGLRPGEVLACLHAKETGDGCGDSEGCRFCGAAAAVRETLRTGAPVTRECRMTTGAGGHAAALDMLARATPFQIDGRRFVLLVLSDTSPGKRRAALERIFFHDILNTVSSFTLYLDMLKAGALDEQARRLIERLTSIAVTLVEEIQSQKVLVSAENRTLSVQRDLIESHGLVERLVQQLEGQDVARERRIVVAGFSEAFSFVSDDSLVKRVLANMLKNALEASPEGEAVTISFRPDPDGRVRFEVHNPGAMPAEVAHQVFQRSFSTKGADRGLGTWSMKLLTEEYLGGAVSFQTDRERGTTFTLLLPRKPKGMG